MRAEFALIEQIRQQVARAGADPSVGLSIGDDAAVVAPTPDHELVLCTDSIVLDRHFDAQATAADIGHLAVAVNLSDLAAMGAQPRWLLLAMTLPDAHADWVADCVQGALDLASMHHCHVIGGNLARGPMNLTVTAIGEVSAGQAVTRRGAQVGDRVLVSGTLGDAAAAVALGAQGHRVPSALLARWRRPTPRVALGRALCGHVQAMIDVSDGLLSDLSQLLGDTLGARLQLADLPTSSAMLAAVADPVQRQHLQLNGGSDYELLMVVSPRQLAAVQRVAAHLGVALTELGEVCAQPGLIGVDAHGKPQTLTAAGWDHFHGR